MSSERTFACRSTSLSATLLFASIVASAPGSAAVAQDSMPVTLQLKTTYRQSASASEPGEIVTSAFLMQAPQAGVLALDLTDADDPLPGEVDPWEDDLKKPPMPTLSLAEGSLCSPLPRDDEDVFATALANLVLLELEAIADAPLELVLWDENGSALALVQSESPGVPLHLVRAVAPRHFFLEVVSPAEGERTYSVVRRRSPR